MQGDSDTSDEALIVRMREGDEVAFRILFERHAAALASRANSMLPRRVRRKVSVADVVQEARITAFVRSREFLSPHAGAWRNWLMRIVELKSREAVRYHADTAKRAAGNEVSRDGRPDTAAFAAREPSPSQMAIASETEGAARRALAALPPDYREVMRLARVEGLPLAEAGRRMGRSREAAKKLYARALAQFTRLFEAESGRRE